jgi:hypothetical protein
MHTHPDRRGVLGHLGLAAAAAAAAVAGAAQSGSASRLCITPLNPS